jgi:AraC-like DNA-binding protein
MMEHVQKQIVLALLAYAVQRDIDAENLCKLSNISYDDLLKGHALAWERKQVSDLWTNAAYLSKDPLFGLHFGEAMQLAALGIVGEIIKRSRTVGEAITHAASFTALVTDLFTMSVSNGDDCFYVQFNPHTQLSAEYPFMYRQMMLMSVVMTIHELDGLILKKIIPTSVSLPFEEQEQRELERILRCKPSQAETVIITFDHQYWDEPIITAHYELQAFLLKKASEQSGDGITKRSVKDKISAHLITNGYLGVPSLEEVAANFNTSSRSLQRRLQEEGVTYQQLADEVRKSFALYYVKGGKYQLKEVSYMLGYNELSAFTRAFKRWTGVSPMQYSKQ